MDTWTDIIIANAVLNYIAWAVTKTKWNLWAKQIWNIIIIRHTVTRSVKSVQRITQTHIKWQKHESNCSGSDKDVNDDTVVSVKDMADGKDIDSDKKQETQQQSKGFLVLL